MPDCIFCKIVKGDIPCNKIYENDRVLAFLDLQPVNPGHTLVIPKKHFQNLLDIPEDLLCEMMVVVKKLSKVIIKAVNADGFNIGINNNETAGQGIFHMHIHIMPRFKNDGRKLWPGKPMPQEQLKEIENKIKNSL